MLFVKKKGERIKMTIVDLEVVSEAELPRNDFPNLPLGILLEKVFQKNYALYGDAKWMVNKFASGSLQNVN